MSFLDFRAQQLATLQGFLAELESGTLRAYAGRGSDVDLVPELIVETKWKIERERQIIRRLREDEWLKGTIGE